MTIEKGKPWGAPGALPATGVVVRSDAEARAVVEEARRAQEPFPALGLLGGDLCRTVGGPGDEARLRSDAAMSFPVDLGEVLLDGRVFYFVAHLVARGPWWRGRAFVAMNAQWCGPWNLGPRAHPNDGKLDVYEAAVPPGQRLAVRARLGSGTHLPHPAITERRVAAVQHEFAHPVAVYLDGEHVGAFRRLAIRVIPDALTIVV